MYSESDVCIWRAVLVDGAMSLGELIDGVSLVGGLGFWECRVRLYGTVI